MKRECSDDADEAVESLAEKPVDGGAGFALKRDADGTTWGGEVGPAGLTSGEGTVTGTAGSFSGSAVGIGAVVEMDTGVLVDSCADSDGCQLLKQYVLKSPRATSYRRR